ncbi:MAG: hypothetical protein IJT58_04755 [Synergistaceae bacterium]|nr:hypothetical protein [Synergistaceae bacterium]
MNSRKYFYCVVIILFAFMLANLALWHGYTKKIFTQRDLNRLGSFISTPEQTPDKKYSRHRTELRDYLNAGVMTSFDIVTIGDSFSNTPYQDYLEEKYNLRTLNARFNEGCLRDLYIFIQSGLLDRIKPKAIIIETVARHTQDIFGYREEELPVINLAEVEKLIFKPQTAEKISSGLMPAIIIERNINFIHNNLRRYITGSDRLTPEAYIAELDRNLFTNKGQENLLLFYFYDLHYLDKPFNLEIANLNLHNAAKLLEARNIKLIFMPCVDKYDLYYPYIINKRGRPENNLFAELESLPYKNYAFINTKAILREALERGVKDLYWGGDTHWSWRGWEIVCDEIVKVLQ